MAGLALGVFGSTVMSVLLPAAVRQSVRESYNEAECVEHMKQIGLGMHNFHSSRSHFPRPTIDDKQGRPLLSWRVAILPYLGADEAHLYEQFNLKEPWDSPHNIQLLGQMPRFYRCPSEPDLPVGMTPYQITVGRGALLSRKRGLRIGDITSGTSNAFLLGESEKLVPWTAPEDVPVDEAVEFYSGPHPARQHTLYFDGSVRMAPKISKSTAPVAKTKVSPSRF